MCFQTISFEKTVITPTKVLYEHKTIIATPRGSWSVWVGREDGGGEGGIPLLPY